MIGALPAGVPIAENQPSGPWTMRLWDPADDFWVHSLVVFSDGTVAGWWMTPGRPLAAL